MRSIDADYGVYEQQANRCSSNDLSEQMRQHLERLVRDLWKAAEMRGRRIQRLSGYFASKGREVAT